jgi:cell division protein YceG involved in septum cleavage|tara:strand:+ start:28 stop:249 length:222 start_codon:yes stop_codon:yes gene_type:complete
MKQKNKNIDEQIKNFLEQISEAEKKQDKKDIDFITSIIIASLTEEEVAKHIPEEGQRLLRKKLVSLMNKQLGL